MPDWGAIVKVHHQPQGRRLQWPELDAIMEPLSAHASTAGSTRRAVSVRLFVTATDRAGAAEQASDLVLAALRTAAIPHDPSSAIVLVVDLIADFERDFPAPG